MTVVQRLHFSYSFNLSLPTRPMDVRSSLSSIRIVNVTKEGHEPGFGSLLLNLKSLNPSGFIAIDTEFSGITKDPHLSDDNLPKRYAAIRRLANSRAIFSVGISLFNPVSFSADAGGTTYHVATYDFLTCCQDDFMTNANAGAFLSAHDFNFNRMFEKGIPYTRASTEPQDKSAEQPQISSQNEGIAKNNRKALPFQYAKMPRGLLWRLGRQNAPLILHNGLFDLAFLFAAFQAPLAETLDGFIAQLLQTIPAGYWDSKMLASVAGERASFLGYLFAKAVLKGAIQVHNMSGLPDEYVTDPPDELGLNGFDKEELCALYAYRGFCPRGVSCPFLHDPFLVVVEEGRGSLPKDSREAFKRHKAQSKAFKRQRNGVKTEFSKLSKKHRKKVFVASQRHVDQVLATAKSSNAQPMTVEEKHDDNEGKEHTAGWDAFCTGYVFAAYRASIPQEKLDRERNKIALSQKLSGLLLCTSDFADLDRPPPSS